MKNEKNEKISDFWGVSIMLEIRKITIIILDLQIWFIVNGQKYKMMNEDLSFIFGL